MERDVRLLPKAHLHLHFTGSMRPTTLLELADKYGVHLPDALTGGEPPKLRATDERGWFRFQRLYDIARSCLRSPRTSTAWSARVPRRTSRTAPAGWRSRSTPPRTPRCSAG